MNWRSTSRTPEARAFNRSGTMNQRGAGGGGWKIPWAVEQRINLINNSSIMPTTFWNTVGSNLTGVSFSLVDADSELLTKNCLRYEKITYASNGDRIANSDFGIFNLNGIATGGNVTVGLHLKRLTTFTNVLNVAITFYDVNQSYVGLTYSPAITLTTDWTHYTVSKIKSANAVYCRINLLVNGAATGEIGAALPYCISATRIYESYVNQTDIDNYKQTFQDKNISILGDSITRSNDPKSYPYIAQNIRGYKGFRNDGVSGAKLSSATTNNVEEQLATLIGSSYIPNVILISAGTNDCTHQVALGTNDSANKATVLGSLNNLKTIINTTFPNCKIAICTPTQRGTDGAPITLLQYRNAIMNWCSLNGIVCVDNYNCGILAENEQNPYQYTTDGLHPNQAGSFLIGEYTAAQILAKRAYL